ncbi:hypothetical protein J437_LFUL000752, partial [Ladona fulva]
MNDPVEVALAQLVGDEWFLAPIKDTTKWKYRILTTFITPFGPLIVSLWAWSWQESTSETHQRDSFSLEGVVNLADDILMHGRTQEKQDKRLHNVLMKLKDSGVTFNKKK